MIYNTNDMRIERVAFDYAINLNLGLRHQLKIETYFTLTTAEDILKIDPEHPGNAALVVVSLLHRNVTRLEHDTVNLTLDIEGGYSIYVPDDPKYDAWTLSP